ncbi:MAG: DsbA family oxidoreductase [Fibrobacteria bacterium]
MRIFSLMKIEIWSDVMCPFCYLGKRRLENALEVSGFKAEAEIIWKSFQLNPDMKTEPGKGIEDYLVEKKGWSLDQIRKSHARLTQAAAEVGLLYDFEKAVVANSFDAHRLVQLAKTKGLGDAMEERLFKAYFSEGGNIADHPTLLRLAADAGLDEAEAKRALDDKTAFAREVRADVNEAQQLGVNGVPFFVFDRKFAVSGAQDPSVFLKAIKKAHDEAGGAQAESGGTQDKKGEA